MSDELVNDLKYSKGNEIYFIGGLLWEMLTIKM